MQGTDQHVQINELIHSSSWLKDKIHMIISVEAVKRSLTESNIF